MRQVTLRRTTVRKSAAALGPHGRSKAGVENDLVRYGAIASLELVQAPTLVVYGSVDPDVTPEHGDRAATTMPGSERVVMDGGIQLCLWTHPDAAETRTRAAAWLGAPDG
jgi:pimeloyl-ACP methyl ester carboxylesterase